MITPGDQIHIISMSGEPEYKNKVGRVVFIDSIGQLHGTWGSLAINPETDLFEVLNKPEYKGDLGLHQNFDILKL